MQGVTMSNNQHEIYYLYEISSESSVLRQEYGCFLFANSKDEALNRLYASLMDTKAIEIKKVNFCLIPYDDMINKVRFKNESDAREAADMIGRIIQSQDSSIKVNPIDKNKPQAPRQENNCSKLVSFFSKKKNEFSTRLHNSSNFHI